MLRALRPYLNAFQFGFIVTFILYLFIRFNTADVILGAVIAAVGGAVVLAGYVYLERRFGGEPGAADGSRSRR